VRRPISSKPETDPESVDVDATVISVKGVRITRGDPADLRSVSRTNAYAELGASRGDTRDRQKSAEGIVGPSSTGPKARTSRKGEELSFRW
jgi:hypothetical protein